MDGSKKNTDEKTRGVARGSDELVRSHVTGGKRAINPGL
jgi:hypothetical protein